MTSVVWLSHTVHPDYRYLLLNNIQLVELVAAGLETRGSLFPYKSDKRGGGGPSLIKIILIPIYILICNPSRLINTFRHCEEAASYCDMCEKWGMREIKWKTYFFWGKVHFCLSKTKSNCDRKVYCKRVVISPLRHLRWLYIIKHITHDNFQIISEFQMHSREGKNALIFSWTSAFSSWYHSNLLLCCWHERKCVHLFCLCVEGILVDWSIFVGTAGNASA